MFSLNKKVPSLKNQNSNIEFLTPEKCFFEFSEETKEKLIKDFSLPYFIELKVPTKDFLSTQTIVREKHKFFNSNNIHTVESNSLLLLKLNKETNELYLTVPVYSKVD